MREKSLRKNRSLSLILVLLLMITGLTVPRTEVQAEEGGVGGFVNRCYQVTLGRAADASGYADWTNQLTSGKSDGAFVAFGFVFSPEYTNANKSNGEFVTDMYTLFLGRTPDEAGYADWVGQLDAGADRQAIFAGFANSTEFFNICTSYGVTAGVHNSAYDRAQVNNVNMFVARMYRVCFNRLGDQGGQADWVNRLLSGELTGIDCAKGFILSNEYQNLGLSNEAYVKNMYAAFMGRSADEGGFRDWVAKLNAGYTRDEIFAGFANSNEFAQICANYGIIRGDYTPTNCHKGEIVVTEEDKSNVGTLDTGKANRECPHSPDGKHHMGHKDATCFDLNIHKTLLVVDKEAYDTLYGIRTEEVKSKKDTYYNGGTAPAGCETIGYYKVYDIGHEWPEFHEEYVDFVIPNGYTISLGYDYCWYCQYRVINGKQMSYEEQQRQFEQRFKTGDYSSVSRIEVSESDETNKQVFHSYEEFQLYVNQLKETKRVCFEDDFEDWDQLFAWKNMGCTFHCEDIGRSNPSIYGQIVYTEDYLDNTLMDLDVFHSLYGEWYDKWGKMRGNLPADYQGLHDYVKTHKTPRTDLPKYDYDHISAEYYYVDDSQLSDSQKKNIDFDTLYNLYLNTPQE